jgi:hypothetical protein
VTSEGETPNEEDAQDYSESDTMTANNKVDRDMVRWTRAVAILTGCLFIAALLQFFVMRGQQNIMRGQLEVMADDQRPWVFVVKPLIEEPGFHLEDGKEIIAMRFIYKNVGHTPAKYSVGISQLNVVSQRDYATPDWTLCNNRRKLPLKSLRDGITIFPDQTDVHRNRFAIDKKDFARLKTHPPQSLCMDVSIIFSRLEPRITRLGSFMKLTKRDRTKHF